MKFPSHWPRPKLWVVKQQKYLERIFPPIIASIIPFSIPLTIIGIIIGNTTGEKIFTRGVVFSMLWLACAPYLITLAFQTVASFFDKNQKKFQCEETSLKELQFTMVRSLESPKSLFLAIPITLLCIFILQNTIYASSSIPVKIWAGVTFGVLFFLSGVGFWGITRFNHIFETVCQQKLNFDPYHADGFGGLSFLGQFNVKGPQYFFSGALIFPLAVEVVNKLPNNELVVLALWTAIGLFLGFGFAGFLIPQMKIKDIIANYKNQQILDSEAVLQTLLRNLCLAEVSDKESAEIVQLKINVYYQYFHKRILSVKEWPFDWKIILQILSSLLTPAVIAVYEIFLR